MTDPSRSDRIASVGSRRALALLCLVLPAIACSPATAFDGFRLPGWLTAWFGPTQVPALRTSDEEVEMNDRIVRFTVAPQSHGIFAQVTPTQIRTGLLTGQGAPVSAAPYYGWLHGAEFASSTARYATLADDVAADLGTIPDTFTAICKVEEIDRERALALSGTAAGTPPLHSDVGYRHHENDQRIGWFIYSLRYRSDSYGYALDHLLVETPDTRATEVQKLLHQLEVHVVAAEHHHFCGAPGGPTRGSDGLAAAIPSRFEHTDPASAANATPTPVPGS